MWRISVAAFLLLIAMKPAEAQSQREMNLAACAETTQAEAQLQETVERIRVNHREDTIFLAKFETAQVAWRQFADAQMSMTFPTDYKTGEYGSVYPMCACYEKATLINERIKQLQKWLRPREEGDVCVGSRP